MKQKTLSQFCDELNQLSFDKKKVQGLVKRANKAGINIYYRYHEDGIFPKLCSSDQYKDNLEDVKIFEASTLEIRKKPSFKFQRAATYTVECAIFVFCPLYEILKDKELRNWHIERIKANQSEICKQNYDDATKSNEKLQQWELLPESNKAKITALISEHNEIIGTAGSKARRKEIVKEIELLGGWQFELSEWQKEALSFESLESYTEFKQDKAINEFLAVNA